MYHEWRELGQQGEEEAGHKESEKCLNSVWWLLMTWRLEDFQKHRPPSLWIQRPGKWLQKARADLEQRAADHVRRSQHRQDVNKYSRNRINRILSSSLFRNTSLLYIFPFGACKNASTRAFDGSRQDASSWQPRFDQVQNCCRSRQKQCLKHHHVSTTGPQSGLRKSRFPHSTMIPAVRVLWFTQTRRFHSRFHLQHAHLNGTTFKKSNPYTKRTSQVTIESEQATFCDYTSVEFPFHDTKISVCLNGGV